MCFHECGSRPRRGTTPRCRTTVPSSDPRCRPREAIVSLVRRWCIVASKAVGIGWWAAPVIMSRVPPNYSDGKVATSLALWLHLSLRCPRVEGDGRRSRSARGVCPRGAPQRPWRPRSPCNCRSSEVPTCVYSTVLVPGLDSDRSPYPHQSQRALWCPALGCARPPLSFMRRARLGGNASA